MSETTHLALPYLAAAQAQKHVTHNEALGRLDVVVQLGVLDAATTAPPDEPQEGDRYIVAAGASGAWAAHEGEVAAFVDGVWAFAVPGSGWVAFDAASESVLVHAEGSWHPIGSFLGAVDRFGVNMAADDTNRLAVRSEAALFEAIEDADGGSGDIRVVMSKEAYFDTASLIFQDGFSGRAEIGLAGDDDLVFKISDDGTGWIEAIRIDNTSGVPAILYDNGTSGLAATSLHAAIDELATASASTSTKGIVELATDAEARAGTDISRAITPAALRAATREQLTADRTYYVRTDGSDANEGLSNTSGGAFLTIQKAVDVVARLDRSIHNVTISVAAGTYTGAVSVSGWGPGSGTVTILGDVATPSNVLLDVVGIPITFSGGVRASIGGFKIQSTSFGIYVTAGARVTIPYAMDYGACTFAQILIEVASSVTITADYTISGGASAHWQLASAHAVLVCTNRTITLTGTPAFTTFLRANFFGSATVSGNTFSGSATGSRYAASVQAVVYVSGAGATYLPGSTAGSVGSGGQYV